MVLGAAACSVRTSAPTSECQPQLESRSEEEEVKEEEEGDDQEEEEEEDEEEVEETEV